MKYLPIILAALTVLSACSPKTGENTTSGGTGSGAGTTANVMAAGGATIDQAVPEPVGTTVMGVIVAKGPSNFYRFDYKGQQRDLVTVRLTNLSATLRPDIKIYNSDKSQLTEKYDGTPGANVEGTATVQPGGALYVEVNPYDSVGQFQLSVIAQKAYDANEPNDDILHATPVKFGAAIEGSALDDKDDDYFHVAATTASKIEIHLENLSTTLKPDMKVYSADKSQLIEKYDATPGADIDFTVDVQPGRDFYMQVLPYGSVGKYRVTTRVAVQAADMAASLNSAGVVDLYGVYFDTGQATIKPASATTLAEVGTLLKNDPNLRLEISGHTDNTGAAAQNLALSQGRAEAVVAWLVGQYKVDGSRLTARGYGDTKPVAPNDNPDDMAKNRRVELRKSAGGETKPG